METKLAQEQEFLQHQPLLFSIVYNIIGEVEEAKDVVQDSFESWLKLQLSDVRHPKAYLAKIVTHKAVDRLKALKKERETYPGPWLPEPIVQHQPGEQPQKDILPYALLCTLEALNPVERAVLILRESFDFDYHSLAEICGITEANCRQILRRAKEKVQHPKRRSTVDPHQHQLLLEKFLQACKEEDTDELTRLLKEDITFYSDGGGKAAAALHPLFGIPVVTKFLFGVIRKKLKSVFTYRLITINGQPGVLLLLDGKKDTLVALDVEGEKIRQLFFIRNPDKISLQ